MSCASYNQLPPVISSMHEYLVKIQPTPVFLSAIQKLIPHLLLYCNISAEYFPFGNIHTTPHRTPIRFSGKGRYPKIYIGIDFYFCATYRIKKFLYIDAQANEEKIYSARITAALRLFL